jgi:hypothetical protein
VELREELRAIIEEANSRKKYSELTPDIIATIPDDKLKHAIVDFVEAAIDEDRENETSEVPKLGAGFSAVYFVAQLDVEVNNGGFDLFFGNAGKRAVELSKEGAEFIGLVELAGIVGKALAIEESGCETSQEVKRQGAVEALFEAGEDICFDEADKAFSALDVDLEKEIVKFIRQRPDLFVGKLQAPAM